MTEIEVDDGGGSSISLHEVDGYRICSFLKTPEQTAATFKELINFKCRDDDVFICAPIKSGTHWTWEIISMLYNRKAESIPKSKIDHMLEATPFDQLDSIASPRILNTHFHYSMLPRELKEKKCKIVYVLRNPKDLAVSFYHHQKGFKVYSYDGKFENFLQLFVHGKTEYNSWFEYVKEWETLISQNPDLPIHMVFYEDLKENNLQEIYRLGRFLGIENKDGLFEAVSQKCNIKDMKKDKEPTADYKEFTYIGNFSIYRNGDIGDWKNWFTVSQNEQFDAVYEKEMKSSKLKFRYSRSNAAKI